MARRTLFTDEFTQVDDTGLNAANWEFDYSHNWGYRSWLIKTNKVASWYGSSFDNARCKQALPADQWAKIVYDPDANSHGGSLGSIAVYVRMDETGTAAHCYECFFNAFSGEWFAFSTDGTDQFSTGMELPFVAGDELSVEVQGTEIRFYHNDTLFATLTNSDRTVGSAGFGFNGQFSDAEGNPPVGVITTFVCGDFVEEAPPPEEPQIFITT